MPRYCLDTGNERDVAVSGMSAVGEAIGDADTVTFCAGADQFANGIQLACR